jgi:hypothetical protein
MQVRSSSRFTRLWHGSAADAGYTELAGPARPRGPPHSPRLRAAVPVRCRPRRVEPAHCGIPIRCVARQRASRSHRGGHRGRSAGGPSGSTALRSLRALQNRAGHLERTRVLPADGLAATLLPDSCDLLAAPLGTGAEGMAELPSETVTFLFTDVEGRTRLLEAHPEAYRGPLARPDGIIRRAVAGMPASSSGTSGTASARPSPARSTRCGPPWWPNVPSAPSHRRLRRRGPRRAAGLGDRPRRRPRRHRTRTRRPRGIRSPDHGRARGRAAPAAAPPGPGEPRTGHRRGGRDRGATRLRARGEGPGHQPRPVAPVRRARGRGPPLSLPDRRDAATGPHLDRFDAVQLFGERARAAGSTLRSAGRTRATSPRSEAASTAYRWRWSWPPPVCARCRRRRVSGGWTAGSHC